MPLCPARPFSKGGATPCLRTTRTRALPSSRRSPSSSPTAAAATRPCIVVSNDDGVEFQGIRMLAAELQRQLDLPVVVVAPDTNQSACSHKLTIRRPMAVTPRPDLGGNFFAVGGTPADAMHLGVGPRVGIAQTLGYHPVLALSGVNLGPNVSGDVVYSGTVAAAREASFAGVPAIASSLALRAATPGSWESAVEATCQVARAALDLLGDAPPLAYPRAFDVLPAAQRMRRSQSFDEGDTEWEWEGDSASASAVLRDAFVSGDVFLNVNTPEGWGVGARGVFQPTGLGLLYYSEALSAVEGLDSPRASSDAIDLGSSARVHGAKAGAEGRGAPGEVPPFYEIGGGFSVGAEVVGSDVDAIRRGLCSVTTLQAWPDGHPLSLREEAMSLAPLLRDGHKEGLPAWLVKGYP